MGTACVFGDRFWRGDTPPSAPKASPILPDIRASLRRSSLPSSRKTAGGSRALTPSRNLNRQAADGWTPRIFLRWSFSLFHLFPFFPLLKFPFFSLFSAFEKAWQNLHFGRRKCRLLGFWCVCPTLCVLSRADNTPRYKSPPRGFISYRIGAKRRYIARAWRAYRVCASKHIVK